MIRQEVASLMARFAGTNGGYKLSEFDSNGLWLRDLWMDTPDKTTATNILEISMNGIRSSNDGYKPATDPAWKLGITIDGQINADRILTGTIMAGLIKAGILADVAGNFSLNLETGALSAKQMTINSPHFQLKPDGTIRSKTSYEYLDILEALLKGYHTVYQDIDMDPSPTLSGLLDLSADYGNGDYKVVLESKQGMVFKIASGKDFTVDENGTAILSYDGRNWDIRIKSPGQFNFYQGNNLCGYIDGNGWHGNYSTT